MSLLVVSLGLPWRRPKPVTVESRDQAGDLRRPAVDNRASLGWQVGHECWGIPARVREISLLNAVIVTEGRPPSDQPVWLRLEEPSKTVWVEVKVARITASGEVEVWFPGTCPNAIFRAMNHACTRQQQMSPSGPEGRSSR